MSTRRRSTTALDRRLVALGAAAVAVAALIGYVSYNALSGLPLESRYHVTVALPDAARLLPTNDVRIANIRVGQVSSVSSARAADGQYYARIGLKLDPSVGRLPVNTIVRARAASPLGQTYVDLDPGDSDKTVGEGGSLPLVQGRRTVAVTDLFEIFNRHSKRDFQTAVKSLGDGLAGRGAATNATVASLSALMPPLGRVSRALASPAARLPRFLDGFAAFGTALSPARHQLAELVAHGATTFAAIDHQRVALRASLDAAPGAERSTTAAFKAVRPALAKLARASARLQPGADRLKNALRSIDDALRSGARAFRSLPSLTPPLETTLHTLRRVSSRRSTDGGLRKLNEIFAPTQDLLDALLPAQEHCNIFGTMLQNTASMFGTLGTGEGPSYIAFSLATPGQPGEQLQSAKPAPSAHINNTPAESAQRCDSNNEPYTPGKQVLTRPAQNTPNTTRTTSPPPGVLERARAADLLAPDPPDR